MRRFIPTVIIGGALSLGSSNAMGQTTFSMEYTTEWQTDFRGGYDWLNLLTTSTRVPVGRSLTIEAATISTAKTGAEPLVSDLLTYSNIDAPPIPLTFSRLGVALSIKEAELFVGINNVNEDYFTSPQTSFFTNSSCGISPTISCNYDIANYPVASWCIHYRQPLGRFSLQTSLYPGRGYSRLLGHDNLFSLNLKRDGVFSISSIDYTRNGIYTVLGLALHYGHSVGDEPPEPDASPAPSSAAPTEKKLSASPWLLSELSLPHGFGLHLHGSYSTVSTGCKGYAGVGVTYSGTRVHPGVAFNYASFTDASECSVELTCRLPLMGDKASLQPALHLISTSGSSLQCVGALRFNVSI